MNDVKRHQVMKIMQATATRAVDAGGARDRALLKAIAGAIKGEVGSLRDDILGTLVEALLDQLRAQKRTQELLNELLEQRRRPRSFNIDHGDGTHSTITDADLIPEGEDTER